MSVVNCIHVITRLILGGAQENTLLTVEGLNRTGAYRTKLVTGPPRGPEGELLERARRNGVEVLVLEHLQRNISPWHDALAYRDLLRIIREEHPEIVHTHSSKAGILARRAARREGVPVIIHTIHGSPFHPHQNKAANLFYQWLERQAARWSNRIISVADAMTKTFLEARIAPPEKFVTIYSGMEVEPFLSEDGARKRIRAEMGIGERDIVIGKIARLFQLKGHADVLKAFAGIAERFPSARLLFVGDGVLRSSLDALARRLGVRDRLTFAGLVPPERIPQMIKAMDLLVHASLREGLARVLPQALLSGCPVVSYDVDGAREVVQNGVTGFLVPPQSIEGLRDALAQALCDLGAARQMALRGRDIYTHQFRADTMVARIQQVYEEELDRCGIMPRQAAPNDHKTAEGELRAS